MAETPLQVFPQGVQDVTHLSSSACVPKLFFCVHQTIVQRGFRRVAFVLSPAQVQHIVGKALESTPYLIRLSQHEFIPASKQIATNKHPLQWSMVHKV